MAKVNIKRMSVLALQKDKDRILKLLQKMGNIEVIDLKEEISDDDWCRIFEEEVEAKNRDEIEGKLNDITFALDFISRYDKTKKPLFADKPVFKEEALAEIAEKKEIWGAIQKCRRLDEELNEIKSEEMKLYNIIAALEPWKNLQVPIEDVGVHSKVAFLTGTLPAKGIEKIQDEIKKTVPESSIQVIGGDRETSYVFLAYYRDGEQRIMDILKNNGWSKVDLPKLQGTPEQALQQAETRLAELDALRQEIVLKANHLIEYRSSLEVLADYFSMLKARKDVYQNTGKTKYSFYLEGWVPEPQVERVVKALRKEIEGINISFRDPKDGEDVPMVLKNPKFVEPFELITELYSLPNQRDIDPNLFMAPFFFIYFGMMVSDAGYGIIMSLLAVAAMKMIKPKGMAKKLFDLIFLGGVSTFIWGAIFGGWFGNLIKLPPIWMNPLDDPIRLLIFSFILGIIQIYTGLCLQAYKNIRDGNTTAALFDQGMWMIFLAGCIMFALPGMAQVAKIVAIAGAIGLVLTQGRHQRNPVLKLGSGILSLYDATGFLSDVLSYSRVLALGLATGVIATVINTMGELIGVNFIGYIFMIILLIGGHLFNIAINALGAYVHSSRLQYVEFFSKFYEGGGRAFQPFKINTKYINLENGEEI